MLRGNAWDSGKCSLALPLQRSNLEFFDIFEGSLNNIQRFQSESVGKEVGFKNVRPCVFVVEDCRYELQQCIAAGKVVFEK